jgi:surface antigen
LIGIGLAVAFTAHAHSNNAYLTGYGETANLNLLHESTLYNTPGYPNEEAYEAKRIADEKAKSRYLAQGVRTNQAGACNCVIYSRAITGINVGPIGLAKYHPVNSQTPVVGAIAVFGGSWTGHLAVVVDVRNDGTFTVTEGNWVRCRITTGRVVHVSDPTLKGFYK